MTDEFGGIKQMFYRSATDFAAQYDINEELVVEILTATKFQQDLPTATLLGISEMDLLKKLDLWLTVEGYDDSEDPRNLIYIIYTNI